MKSIAVIYWSGTGNTEKMASAVVDGAKTNSEASVKLLEVGKTRKEDVLEAEALAFGCPAMGEEQLEEEEMEPFIDSLSQEELGGKPVALFGSYDWGEGQWMRDWEDRMKDKGAVLIDSGLIIQNDPEDEGLESCEALGKKLAFFK
jgi:flavodoxin I